MMEENTEVEEHYATEELGEDTAHKITNENQKSKISKRKDAKNDMPKQQHTIWHAS